MAVSKGFNSEGIDKILAMVSEEELLQFYFGVTTIPCKINAPYRMDNNPSVGVFFTSDHKLRYKDFGTNESGTVFHLIQKTFGLDVNQTIAKILSDFKTPVNSNHIKQTYNKRSSNYKGVTKNIQVKVRDWKDYDLEFWEKYGVSLPWLKFGEVYPISRIFYEKEDGSVTSYPAEKYAYCYVERKDGKVTLKIYQPLCKDRKWISKHNNSIWDLWTQLPQYGDILIITSSRKDALCVWENTGIPSVSLQGEGYIPKTHVVNQLKARFKEVYVLYDNDFASKENYGRNDGKKLCDLFDLKQIEIPESYHSKDPSDLCKNYNRLTVKQVITKLIDESRNKQHTEG